MAKQQFILMVQQIVDPPGKDDHLDPVDADTQKNIKSISNVYRLYLEMSFHCLFLYVYITSNYQKTGVNGL